MRALLHAAGARARARAPFAWLSHEDEGGYGRITVRLRLWPGGQSLRAGRGASPRPQRALGRAAAGIGERSDHEGRPGT